MLHGMGLYYVAPIVCCTAFRVVVHMYKIVLRAQRCLLFIGLQGVLFCVQWLVGYVFREYWHGTLLDGVVRLGIGWCYTVLSCMFCALCMYRIG